jgi:hypothetical protein
MHAHLFRRRRDLGMFTCYVGESMQECPPIE